MRCLAQGNETFGNFAAGILAIDGAHDSRIVDNNSHDNGAYDVELSGDSFRFGFLTPSCFSCTFTAGFSSRKRMKYSIRGRQPFASSTRPRYRRKGGRKRSP